MTRPNAFEVDFSDKYDPNDPDGYRVAEAPFGKAAGAEELLVRLYELPSGQNLCPYHYEYVEEWLLVMVGEVQVRTPDGISAARAGDLVRFASGPDGVHQVYNQAEVPARVVMFSAATVPSVAVYPDSGKVGLWTANQRDAWMFRGAEGKLAYFDGEPPAGRAASGE